MTTKEHSLQTRSTLKKTKRKSIRLLDRKGVKEYRLSDEGRTSRMNQIYTTFPYIELYTILNENTNVKTETRSEELNKKS